MSNDAFYDILFDPTRSIVEKQSQQAGCHVTALYENGKLLATREITSDGVEFYEGE